MDSEMNHILGPCKEADVSWRQTESLAAVPSLQRHCPSNSIDQMIDRKGWLLYRRSDGDAHRNLWSEEHYG